jgi:hypothetical protein
VRVDLHPDADAEFAAQVEYYNDRQPGLGERFYHEVISILEWIEENPTLPRMRRNYRRVNLKVFPFYIAYVTQDDLIWVLAVAHGRRRPGYWIARMKA